MDEEVIKTIGEIRAAFEAFKTANDERIEAKFKDVVTEEKVNRINGAISELQTTLEASQKRVDELEAAAQRPQPGVSGAVDFKAEANQFFAGVNNQADYEATADEIAAYTDYQRRFNAFLRKGNKAGTIEAAMRIGGDPEGGYFVPTGTLGRTITKIRDTSPMRQVASVISITTDSVEWMRDMDQAGTGGWAGETDQRTTTTTPKMGKAKIYVHEQYAMPEITQRLLDMSTVNVEEWLGGKVADRMGRDENEAYVNGDGSSKPRGFLNYASAAVATQDKTRADDKLQFIPTTQSAGFKADAEGDVFINAVAALHPNYRAGARWTMNRLVEAEVRKLKDADNRYLVNLDVTDGITGFNLAGYPITNFEDMPDIAANTFSIGFGNWSSGYLIVDGRGIRILRDPYTNKGFVRYYTTKFTGGDVIDFAALKLIKFGS